MGDFVCNHEECQAHQYVMGLIADLKEDKTKMEAAQKLLTENVIKMTENLLELQRYSLRNDEMLKELKEFNGKQDSKIDKNSAFMYKAIGVVGSFSMIIALIPLVLWIVDKVIGKTP